MSARRAAAALLLMLAVSCKDSTAPVQYTAPASLRIVSGVSVTDTVFQWLAQPLVVEVRDSTGAALPGAIVRFDPIVETGQYGTPFSRLLVAPIDTVVHRGFYAATTDAQGRAAVRVELGITAGRAGIVVSAPEGGATDTAWYNLLPTIPERVQFVNRDTTLVTGGALAPSAVVLDRFGNVRDDRIALTVGGAVASVDAARVVHAGSPGRGWVAARVDNRVDTMRISVVPQATIAVVEDNGGGSWSITAVSLDGLQRRRLITTRTPMQMPAWNPAGTEVAYNEGYLGYGGSARLFIVTTAGARRALLPTMPALLKTAGFPRFSPDGEWIYFTGDMAPAADPNYYWTTFTTWRVRRDGSAPERLLPDSSDVDRPAAWEADAAPDGARIVLSHAGTISFYDLAARTVTSTGVVGEMPRISPAGDAIAYYVVVPGLVGPIHLMNADGSNARELTPGYVADRVAGYSWSPDGDWIVVRGTSRLALVRVSTGEIVPLPYSAAMFQPAFRP
jgi:Tol biopolymer transport system component